MQYFGKVISQLNEKSPPVSYTTEREK